jgi:hypothetical protein
MAAIWARAEHIRARVGALRTSAYGWRVAHWDHGGARALTVTPRTEAISGLGPGRAEGYWSAQIAFGHRLVDRIQEFDLGWRCIQSRSEGVAPPPAPLLTGRERQLVECTRRGAISPVQSGLWEPAVVRSAGGPSPILATEGESLESTAVALAQVL